MARASGSGSVIKPVRKNRYGDDAEVHLPGGEYLTQFGQPFEELQPVIHLR